MRRPAASRGVGWEIGPRGTCHFPVAAVDGARGSRLLAPNQLATPQGEAAMDTLISAGRRALVLAMASVLAAGGTVLASGPGTAAMDPEMVAALERDLGMSRQQYSAALEVERQIPALESSAQELFGEHYAGTWIEYGVSGDPRVVVGTTRGIR